MKIQSLADLKTDPKNARRHNPRNLGIIEDSIRQIGAARSGVIDEDGVILAGNGTYEALSAAGVERVKVVEADGNEWVVVQRKGLTEEQKRILSISDNRAAELATWDGPALADQGIDLDVWFTDKELSELGAEPAGSGSGSAVEDVEPQIDKAEELREKWGVETGQLWELGEHRLLCGSSVENEDIDVLLDGDQIRLIWTDPPYGVSYGEKNEFLNAISPGNRIQTPIVGDHLTEGEVESLSRNALTLACEHAAPGAAVYVAVPGGPLHRRFIDALNASGFTYKHQLVWVKNQFVLGRADYHYKHEPILYGWKENGAHYFVDDHGKCTVFQIDKPRRNDLHPTMKPVELVEEMVNNSSKPGWIVYDPFSGSGTTLIACERLGRKCRAIEISPAYVAVALQRWADATGKEPKLL